MSNSTPSISSKWTQYTITHRHEKRADRVCEICHARKTKCDLQERRRNGLSDCSLCSRSGRQCTARVPKRRPRRAMTTDSSSTSHPSNNDIRTTASNSNTANNVTDRSADVPITPRSHDETARLSTGPEFDVLTMMKSSDSRNHSWPTTQQPAGFPAVHVSPQDRSTSLSDPNRDRHERRHREADQGHKGDVDTGFINVLGPENAQDAARIEALKAFPRRNSSNGELQVSEELLNIFADTYFNDCYAFCPILDRETLHQDLAQSPMLQNALATLGSNVRPPILPHEGPAVHYDRARRMFYEDEEPDNLTCLRGILLFYWYAPRSTATVHRHSSWWWTSIVIRHAQQMAMHRAAASLDSSPETSGLGRRVWWTAFARERLTALCQSKPPIIDPNDCSVPEPSLNDFPLESRNDPKALIFIYWVRLCAIIGQIAQVLSRTTPSNQSPGLVAEHCRGWIASLPPQTRISLTTRYVTSFDRDAYQLHIPYLIAITILYLRRVREPGALPIALPPAIFAASCVARIYRAVLAKGDTRFLMPITSWYCAVPYMTLLSASRDPTLREAALADMEIIVLMCDQLRKMWASSNVVYSSFERLRAMAEDDSRVPSGVASGRASVAPQGNDLAASRPNEALPASNSFDWIDYFPFASSETSRTVEILLEIRQRDTYVTDPITWDPSLLETRDWSDVMLSFNDFTFDNEFLDPWMD